MFAASRIAGRLTKRRVWSNERGRYRGSRSEAATSSRGDGGGPLRGGGKRGRAAGGRASRGGVFGSRDPGLRGEADGSPRGGRRLVRRAAAEPHGPAGREPGTGAKPLRR